MQARQARFVVRASFLFAFCSTPALLSQRPAPISHEEDVEIESILRAGRLAVSTRIGERILQKEQERVIHRNDRRPVGAGILVKARGGPHAAEYLTDENGEITIPNLPGLYKLKLDIVDRNGVVYKDAATLAVRNRWPRWVYVVSVAVVIGCGVCVAKGPCRPNGVDATVSLGTGRVGPRQ